jgi:hypothetical protein
MLYIKYMAETGSEVMQPVTAETAPVVTESENTAATAPRNAKETRNGILRKIMGLFGKAEVNDIPIHGVTPASSEELNPPPGPQLTHPAEANDLAAKSIQSAQVKP